MGNVMIDLELTEGGWFEGLPLSQKTLIEGILAESSGEEEVAEIWLARPGSSMNAAFGGDPASHGSSFFANVKAEFVAFMCGAPRYSDERNQAINILNKAGKTGLVSYVAITIAPHVGYAVVIITPIAALLLSLTSKVTLSAFCMTNGYDPSELSQ